MRFAICPGCKVSITLPEGYVSYGPWLSAHAKTCPGEAKPRVLARARRKKKGEKQASAPDAALEGQQFLEDVGRLLGRALFTALTKK